MAQERTLEVTVADRLAVIRFVRPQRRVNQCTVTFRRLMSRHAQAELVH